METLTLKIILQVSAPKYLKEITYLEQEIISPNILKLNNIFNDLIRSVHEMELIPLKYTNRELNSLYLVFGFKTIKGSYIEKVCIFDGYGASKEGNVWYYKNSSWFTGGDLVKDVNEVKKIVKYVNGKFNKHIETNYTN